MYVIPDYADIALTYIFHPFNSFIDFRYLYSAPSEFLLRGAPDYSADTVSEFHAEAPEQLRVKDLPRVPTRRLEVDSNPQPSGCKAPDTTASHKRQIVLNHSLLLNPIYGAYLN